MKIVIKTTNLKLSKDIENYIQEKFDSLEKFLKIFQAKKYYNSFFTKGKPTIEIWLEIGRTTLHHQTGPVFRAEAQLKLPGRSIRSEVESDDLKLAITEVKDELQRELKQYNEKSQTRAERRARILKKDLKISPAARFYRKGRIREEGI